MLQTLGIRRDAFVWLVLAACAIYAALAWCPSSYSLVLRNFGVQQDGLVAFEPRLVRSDEYASWTPAIQAVVDADFGQVNVTSPYRESHRHLLAMPLRDWGLFFKPLFWGFLALPPAWAYSSYFAGLYALFLLGWYWLFLRWTHDRGIAIAATLLLFWTGYSQTWWTSLGQHLAVAPWFFLLLHWPLRPWLRVALTTWLGTFALIGLTFYPPLLLNLGILLALGMWLLEPTAVAALWRDRPRVLATAAGLALAVALSLLYLEEPLSKAFGSGHGQRNVPGGRVDWEVYLGLFFPFFPTRGDQLIAGSNFCEVSSAGSYFWVLILLFTDWRATSAKLFPAKLFPAKLFPEPNTATSTFPWRPAVVLGVFLLWMSVWMLAPLPGGWGAPLLWNKFLGTRLLFSAGLGFLLLALSLLPYLVVKVTPARGLALVAVVTLAWWPSRLLPSSWHPKALLALARQELDQRWNADLYLVGIAILVALVLVAQKDRRWSWPPLRVSPRLLLAVAALANGLVYADFNPIMSAKPIFERPWSPRLDSLRDMQEAHPEKILVVGNFALLGRVANGYGFRAINHSFIVPEPTYWRRRFPDLEEGYFRYLFDRYHFLQLGLYEPPENRVRLTTPRTLGGDLTLVAADQFLPPTAVEISAEPPQEKLRHRGELRLHAEEDGWWRMAFAGEINGFSGHTQITLFVDRPAIFKEPWVRPRTDEFDLDAGIRLYSRVDLMLQFAPGEGTPGLCIRTRDPQMGSFYLSPPATPGLRSLCPPAP